MVAKQIRNGRTYRHRTCGGETRVSGDNFEWLSDPFLPCTGTYCAGCRRHGGLGAFEWSDTGETIAARRARLRRGCPAMVKVWGWLIGPILAAVLGAGIAAAVTGRPREGAVAGALTGWAMCAAVLPSQLAKRVWGYNFRSID
jgi:hypothetical protein